MMLDVCDRVQDDDFLSDIDSINHTTYIRYKFVKCVSDVIRYFEQELKGQNPNKN